ncbi:TAXI family TRAP transporter solute-binding subunit [Paremcibacter congregatus]|uniref:TAXI family TRAP transporter solute-binding subunit n=1 Tax=Paremcibacter congregatus TaxID=2043170 RepID=UPI003A8EA02E
MKYIVIFLITFSLWGCGSESEDRFITIGTGGVTGIYYPAGAAICRMVNRHRTEHGLRCSVEATGGSIYNIRAVRNGDLDIGVTQSDWQYHAYQGAKLFEKEGRFEKLRAVFSLHSEPFTVIARKDSGVKTFADLKGKRVNIGNPGSGSRATVEALLAYLGWGQQDFAIAAELKAAEQSQALCDNKLDAIIYVVGHPSGAIKEATTSCESVVVEVAGPVVDKLVAETPYYSTAIIPGGMYNGSPEDVKTFGMRAVFVTSADVKDDVIYQITKAVVGDLDNFKRLHIAFQMLKVDEMASAGLVAPLHPGAEKYFREVLAFDAEKSNKGL